jgi:hypothetical protein
MRLMVKRGRGRPLVVQRRWQYPTVVTFRTTTDVAKQLGDLQ